MRAFRAMEKLDTRNERPVAPCEIVDCGVFDSSVYGTAAGQAAMAAAAKAPKPAAAAKPAPASTADPSPDELIVLCVRARSLRRRAAPARVGGLIVVLRPRPRSFSDVFNAVDVAGANEAGGAAIAAALRASADAARLLPMGLVRAR